jgi:limonene 1,2-monooxygenase
MHLLTSDEPLSVKTARYELVEARSHLRPFSYPLFETAVTAVTSPTGPRLAGKHGMGVLSVAASSAEGFNALANHWSVVEESAAEHGRTTDRASWRLVAPMHIADTKRQAVQDVRFGLAKFQEYFLEVLSGSILRAEGRTADELVEWINESGFGVIGTPNDAITMVERLQEQSSGFGCLLLFHHEWALPDATRRHYELFARFVKPRFQRMTDRLLASAEWCRSVTPELRPKVTEAAQAAIRRHAEERSRRASVADL